MTDTTDPQTARFRHRTPEVEAVQWTGDNADQLRAFCGPDFDEIDLDDRTEDPDQTAAVREADHGTWRGLAPGDWVVRLDEGLYEFAAADFAKQYEPTSSAAVSPPPATDRAGQRDRIAAAIWERQNPGRRWADCEYRWRADAEADADAVLSVLPPDGRAGMLLWAADEIDAETRQLKAAEVLEPDKYRPCRDASALLRRLAAGEGDEQQAQQECTLCGHRTCMLGKPCGVIATERGDLAERCGCTGGGAQQDGAEAAPVSREWCKCPSCWGWFVEDHPGEDLDELGRDLGWWSGLPEHRDAPAGVRLLPDTETPDACTCASAGDAFAPVRHYADCPSPEARQQHAAAAPVAGQPPAGAGEKAQPRFVRVCTPCPECDHTLDENGACANGCTAPSAVVAEPGKESDAL